MNLIRTSFLNGIAVTLKIFAMLGINKLLAVYVGSSGYAIVGQFQNIVQVVSTVASGAVGVGVTKYTAEYYDSPESRYTIWQTASFVAIVNSIAVIILLVVFRNYLALLLLKDLKYASVFVWLSFALVALVFNTLFLAILNGHKQILRFVLANIAGSILSFFIVGILAWKYQLYGALVALSIYQGVGLISTFAICYRTKWFKIKLLFGRFDFDAFLLLLPFAVMTLVSAVAMPVSSILVRHLLTDRFGIEAAGQWEAMMRISSAYLLFLTSVMAVYYLPHFSGIKKKDIFLKEIKKALKLLFIVSIVASCLVYLMRNFIVLTLFSADFLPVTKLFAFQVMGDVLKMGGWLLGYVLLSKAMVKIFIAAEIVFSLTFYLLVNFLTLHGRLENVSLAYFINYCGYFVVLFCCLPQILKRMNHDNA